jgi:hypothetical protein
VRSIERLSYASVLALLLLLGLPSAGMAKGPGLDRAVLEGPGIERPIVLRDRLPYLLSETVLRLAFGSSRERDISRKHPRSDALGPRYRLAYHMAAGRPIVVELYPYAAGGPQAFAEPGQAMRVGVGDDGKQVLFAVNSGWYDYPRRLVSDLGEQGLPSQSAVTGGGWPPPAWIAGLVTVSWGGFLTLRRRRSGGNGSRRTATPA